MAGTIEKQIQKFLLTISTNSLECDAKTGILAISLIEFIYHIGDTFLAGYWLIDLFEVIDWMGP